MSYTAKKLDKSQLELNFSIKPTEYQKDLEAAAVRLSERAAIKGFRAGKAPYEIVKSQLGEVRILEEALDRIVQKHYFEAVKTEKAQTVGHPKIDVKKLAPGNDIEFIAIVALLPNVKLPEFKDLKVKTEQKKIGEKELKEALEHLQKMQPKETPKTGPADKKDKVTVNMEMLMDKVPVEGGWSKNHQVYLQEKHYIPGFAEQLIGMKKDDTKEFTLTFPKEHYQKQLAGKLIDFKVKINEVYELTYPELNDDFAKTLGQPSMDKLKELLTANLQKEADSRETQRVEADILEQLIEKSKFDEIPDVLIDSEKQRMFYELKHDLDNRGISIEQYLKDIKKTEKQIFDEFLDGATKRAKAALISREVAVQNEIKVTSEEIKQEVELIKDAYQGDNTVEENLKRVEVLDTIAATLQNKKVLEFLKKKVLETK